MMDRIRPVLSPNNASAAMTRGAFRLSDGRTVPCITNHRSGCHIAATLAFVLTMGSIFATPAVAQERQPLQRPGSLRGTVINALTGEPIGRALVYTSDNRFARFTDSEGHFDYSLPKAVIDDAVRIGIQSQSQFMFCCIQARKPGYLSESGKEQGMQMSWGAEPVIALIPEGLIKGRVTLPSSEAAPGMPVELFSRQVQDGVFHWARGQEAQTNSNGEFRFAELSPGEYKIGSRELMDSDPSALISEGQLHGFPPVYFPGTVDFASANPVQLKAGQTFEADLSPVRQAYYPVRIPVVGDVENGMVMVSVQGHDSPGHSLGFRPDRQIIDGFLPDGTYQVSMQTFQPNSASGIVTLTVSGGPAQGSRMVLSQHGSIRINVTEDFTSSDESGSGTFIIGNRSLGHHGPRLYLQASLEPIGDLSLAGGQSIRPPTGPDDDTLVIDNVAPGSYHLRPFAARGYVASAAAGGVDLLQEPLVVSSGSAHTIDINLRDDFAQVDGSPVKTIAALNPSTKPDNRASWQPAVYVYFIPQAGGTGQFQEIGTDSEGKFQLPNVAPGKYLVLAFEKQQMNLPYRDVEAMRIYEPKGQTLRLAAGQKEKLELHIISDNE